MNLPVNEIFSSVEEWREIQSWPKYQVSNLGRVRRLDGLDAREKYFVAGRILKPVPVKSGTLDSYRPLCVTLSDGKRCKYFKIAHLVLYAFRGPPPSKQQNCCRHLDDDQTNNTLSNLFWGTQKDNSDDRTRNGLVCRGEDNNKAILSELQVKEIRQAYVYHSRQYGTVALAKKYNVSHCTIWSVIKNETWKHIV